MTKQQLIDENNRLARELANALAINQGVLRRLKEANQAATISHAGDDFVPVPLTKDQKDAFRDYFEDQIGKQHGNGNLLHEADGEESWELVIDPNEHLLPRFNRYLVQYSYNHEEGTYFDGQSVWGLVKLKRQSA